MLVLIEALGLHQHILWRIGNRMTPVVPLCPKRYEQESRWMARATHLKKV